MSNHQAKPASEKKTQSNKDNHVPHSSTISLAQFRPFLEIAIPFFKQDRLACCCLISTMLLTVTKSMILVFFSYARRDMFSALNHKNTDDFYDSVLKFFGVLVVFVPIAVVYHHLRLRLALHWRKEMTIWVLDKYYSNRTYYIIESCRDIDNPDQRISEDLREFTSTSLEFFFILFKAMTNLLLFSMVLYRIYPPLFLAIIMYASMGTYITTRLGLSLVGQYYHKLLTEANFRFGLIRTRENAEGIAFYDSDASMEQASISNLFEQVVDSNLRIIYTRRNIEMFTVPYDYLVYVIPYVVLAPMYFSGAIDLGSVTQGCDAFNNVRNDFSVIVDYFEKLSLFAAGVERLSSFVRRVSRGGWESEVQDPQPPHSIQSTVIAVLMRLYRFIRCIGNTFYRRKGERTKYGDCDIRNLYLFGKVRSDEDCDDDLDLVKSKNNTQSNDPEGSTYTTHTAHMKGQNQNKNKNQDQDQHENQIQNPLHSALKLNCRRSTIQFVAIDHHHSLNHSHSGDLGLALESANIASSLDSSDVTTCKQKKSSSTSSSLSTSSSSCPVLICSNLTVYTPDGSRALIGAIGTVKHADNTENTKNTDNSKNTSNTMKIEKIDVEVDGLGLKERAKGSNTSNRNTTGMVSPSSNKDYIIDEYPENEGSERGVNFEVYKGDRVLISGPSGTGKSSLLRAISGLWEMGDGKIAWKSSINQTYAKVNQHGQGVYTNNANTKNNSNSGNGNGSGSAVGGRVGGGTGVGAVGGRAPGDVFFLPQKPYNLLGTLREQIAYPGCYPEYGTGEETDGSGEGVKGGVVRRMKGSKERIGMINSEKVGDKDMVEEGEDVDEDNNDDDDDEEMNERNNMRMNRDETQAQGQQLTQSHTVKSENLFGRVSKQDEKLLNILKKVHLDTLASRMGGGDESEGLGIEKDWSKVLSLGEQQRLAFARVLYNKSRISVIVLDEATSALDDITEAAMYGLLGALGVTYISVGHRSTLLKFHNRKITLNGPGVDVQCDAIR